MRRIGCIIAIILVTVIAASAAEKNLEFEVTAVRHSVTRVVYSDPPWVSTACQMGPTATCVSGGSSEHIARYDFWQEVKASDGTLYRLHRTDWAMSNGRSLKDGAIVLAKISGDKMYLTGVDLLVSRSPHRWTLKFTILETIPPSDKTK